MLAACSLICYQILAFYEVFPKSENAIEWGIILVTLSYQSTVRGQMSVSEIRFKAYATCVLMSTLKL